MVTDSATLAPLPRISSRPSATFTSYRRRATLPIRRADKQPMLRQAQCSLPTIEYGFEINGGSLPRLVGLASTPPCSPRPRPLVTTAADGHTSCSDVHPEGTYSVRLRPSREPLGAPLHSLPGPCPPRKPLDWEDLSADLSISTLSDNKGVPLVF